MKDRNEKGRRETNEGGKKKKEIFEWYRQREMKKY
jgi:hypothetical protein